MDLALSSRLLATIRRQRMILPGDRVAVAVSGGGDSVALLLLLIEIRETLGATLMVAHFNHKIRPGEAEEDERFVGELADRLGLRCAVHTEDVAARSRQAGTNLEAEARERRYLFFHELISQGRATRIATGHTVDDQAETVLSRLARGSGLRGLGAIHPVLGSVVRPQIEIRRQELREYLRMREQPWREDGTNADTTRLRARIRHKLLPAWESEFGPGGVESLARLANLARNDEALLDEMVNVRFGSLARREHSQLILDARDILDPYPELKTAGARQALGARLVRLAAQEMNRNPAGLTAAHVARVLDLAGRGTSGSRVELPDGLVVERVLNRLVFSPKNAAKRTSRGGVSYTYSADPWNAGETVLPISETGKRLRLKLIDWPPAGRETYREGFGVLDADRLEPPLLVRNGLPGDSYRPRGRGHAEKLKRLLLQRRIAGKDRSLWPVLTSAGRLVWVSGLPVAADFAAGDGTQKALVISEESGETGGESALVETGTARDASNQSR